MKVISLNHSPSEAVLGIGSPRRRGTGLSGGILPILFLLSIGLLTIGVMKAYALEPVRTGESVADLVMRMGQGKSVVPQAPSNPRPVARTAEKPSVKKAPWTNEAKASPAASKASQNPQGRPLNSAAVSKRPQTPGPAHSKEILKPVRAGLTARAVPISNGPSRASVSVLKKASVSDGIHSIRGIRTERKQENFAKVSATKGVGAALSPRSGLKVLRSTRKEPVPVTGSRLSAKPLLAGRTAPSTAAGPKVRAKALLCVDCSSNKVVLAENEDEPLPIASISKLLTAMIVIDRMDLDKVLKVPWDIKQVPRHRVGLRPGELLTTKDLLHGLLIESGNDCAEVLARAYPKGGRYGFIAEMNKLAARLGASHMKLYTPSGLDTTLTLGRKGGRELESLKSNVATAEDVALIARHAFKYPLIRQIAAMKTYTMHTRNPKPREHRLATNDKLLYGKLPVAGAKTGYTNLAGRCIVALFKDEDREHMVVVLNTAKHFKAAEKIYRWACKPL